jgi:hypothetical protein
MKPSFRSLFLFLLCAGSPALANKEAGNGGDLCEDRIRTVATDIASWISRGGSVGLNLPASMPLARYDSLMLDAIRRGQVECIEQTIRVDGTEKTCRNFTDSTGGTRIVCNADRFAKAPADDQYLLVHHEYAGIAGIETNVGPASQYPISNQITGYLEDQVVKKLTVKLPVFVAPNSSAELISQGISVPGTCAAQESAMLSKFTGAFRDVLYSQIINFARVDVANWSFSYRISGRKVADRGQSIAVDLAPQLELTTRDGTPMRVVTTYNPGWNGSPMMAGIYLALTDATDRSPDAEGNPHSGQPICAVTLRYSDAILMNSRFNTEVSDLIVGGSIPTGH